jgi:serine/threonine protein kinase
VGGADDLGLVGQALEGPVRVDRYVGEGDLSIVYCGHHLGLDAPVAVKCLNLPITLEPSLVTSFAASFSEGCHLHYRLSRGHLHIAQSISSGVVVAPRTGREVPYLVREWLEGCSLAQDFARRRAEGSSGRSLKECIELLEPAASALGYAHADGVVHGRVNPANLFLATGPGTRGIKVLDFGVANAMHNRERKVASGPSSELQVF